MEYVYAALLIHKAGGKVDEATLKKVLSAAGASADDARCKALVASLEGVDIDKATDVSALAVAAAPAAAPAAASGGAKADDKKKAAEEEKKTEEEAAAGLGALFG